MKKFKGMLAVIAIVLFIFSQPIKADDPTEEQATLQAVDIVLNSTVIITAGANEGSGFYISEHEIITNQHVVKDTKTVFFKKANGANCLGDVVFKQIDTDLALIKTDCEGKPLTLSEDVKVGQTVLAMGNPLGQEFFVSKGMVGLVNRNGVLHDAAIESGMSGGPVVGLDGRLVGITQGHSKDMPRMSIAIDIKTLSYFLYQAKEEN